MKDMRVFYEQRKESIDLSKVYQQCDCSFCSTKVITIDIKSLISGAKCAECGEDLIPWGEPFTSPIPFVITSVLRDATQRYTERYQSDFLQDEMALNNYEGKFLWGCRKHGTDLVLFDDKIKNAITWIVGPAFYENYGNTKTKAVQRSKVIYYWDEHKLYKVSHAEAMKLWFNHCRVK